MQAGGSPSVRRQLLTNSQVVAAGVQLPSLGASHMCGVHAGKRSEAGPALDEEWRRVPAAVW